jgi:2,5-dihydroxypyridine 5,6-dioxygenase
MPDPLFVNLCRTQLELCGIHEGSRVAVLSHAYERLEHVEAFLAAAAELGASAFNVRLANSAGPVEHGIGSTTYGRTPLAGNRPALDALMQAELVVDTMFLLFSKEQLELQAAGVRVLLCVEPLENLRELFPTTERRQRVEAAGELLAGASSLRFTNAHGTDVRYRLGAYPVITQYGYTDTPGRWDHWPSGFLFTSAYDDGVDGRVVIAPGDIVYPFNDYVRTAIELTVEAGRVVDIAGGLDADLLRDFIDGFEDERGYAISHIGWGMHELARWGRLATDARGLGMHGRSFYGNVLFSTGPNVELGGSNDTPCHVDVPMRNCSLYLDDEPVVIDGDIVVDELKATRNATR